MLHPMMAGVKDGMKTDVGYIVDGIVRQIYLFKFHQARPPMKSIYQATNLMIPTEEVSGYDYANMFRMALITLSILPIAKNLHHLRLIYILVAESSCTLFPVAVWFRPSQHIATVQLYSATNADGP